MPIYGENTIQITTLWEVHGTCAYLSVCQPHDEGGLLDGPDQGGNGTLEDDLVTDHLLLSPGGGGRQLLPQGM